MLNHLVGVSFESERLEEWVGNGTNPSQAIWVQILKGKWNKSFLRNFKKSEISETMGNETRWEEPIKWKENGT